MKSKCIKDVSDTNEDVNFVLNQRKVYRFGELLKILSKRFEEPMMLASNMFVSVA